MLIDSTLTTVLETIMFAPVRLRAVLRWRAQHPERVKAIATTRDSIEKCAARGEKSQVVVLNVALYLLLLDQDLVDTAHDYVFATGRRRRAFVARHAATLIYEAAEDMTQLLGRDFRTAVEALGPTTSHMQRLNSVSSKIHAFWRTHRVFLGTVRNAMAAHRELDAVRYLEHLEALDPMEVIRTGEGLARHLESLVTAITDIGVHHSAVRFRKGIDDAVAAVQAETGRRDG